MKRPLITITTGDPIGIGPAVTFKALRKIKLNSDIQIVHESRPPIEWGTWVDISQPNLYRIVDLKTNTQLSQHSFQAKYFQDSNDNSPGRLSARKIEVASTLIQSKDLSNQYLVTAPINKSRMIRDGKSQYSGHTEYLQKLFNVPKVVMYLKNHKFGVSLLTVHMPISEVSKKLKEMDIAENIQSTLQYLQRWKFPISEVKILALNPHAGEEGNIGTEEKEFLGPAINSLSKFPFKISGPISADTAFVEIPDHCHYIACYHDQGLIPIKTLYSKETINITLGLPIIRTSPDHGTADNIVGLNIEDSTSMESAILEIEKIATRI